MKVKALRLFEAVRVISRYYCEPAFLKIDLYFLSQYLFQNPFRISKLHSIKKRESAIHTYGETSLSTMETIAQKGQIAGDDVVFELGCGRGRTCFWLHHFIGCKVVGIDYVPVFIQKADQIKKKLDLVGIEFRLEDFLQSDFREASVIYLYGSCYSAPFLRSLVKRLEALPQALKIISVSFPLTDYQSRPVFEVVKKFSAPFLWGTGDVYVQIKKAGHLPRKFKN